MDPFCGSGMTGVAAFLTGRKAILNDLSPAAAHLAWNHTHPCEPADLEAAFAEIEAKVGERMFEIYGTTDESGTLRSSIGPCGALDTSALIAEKSLRCGTPLIVRKVASGPPSPVLFANTKWSVKNFPRSTQSPPGLLIRRRTAGDLSARPRRRTSLRLSLFQEEISRTGSPRLT